MKIGSRISDGSPPRALAYCPRATSISTSSREWLAKPQSPPHHLLIMCIRALDYLPPVDVTFGEFLRAMITADYDLVRDDDRQYRVSVLSAFREWGIYPPDVRSLSVENLLWTEPAIDAHPDLSQFLKDNPSVHADDWDLQSDRRHAYERIKRNAMAFHNWLAGYSLRGKNAPKHPSQIPDAMKEWIKRVESLGVVMNPFTKEENSGKDIVNAGSIHRDSGGYPTFEVHSFRPCRRIGPDGQQLTEFVVEIVQRRKGFFDPQDQEAMDKGVVSFSDKEKPDFWFRGGCTLLIDSRSGRIRYCIKKPVLDKERFDRERAFRAQSNEEDVGGAYLDGSRRNPFAFLHGTLGV